MEIKRIKSKSSLFPSFCRCILKIKYGSDDEKALTKAIDSVFPASKRSLCNKHLKDNVSDYLKKQDWCKYKRQSQHC